MSVLASSTLPSPLVRILIPDSTGMVLLVETVLRTDLQIFQQEIFGTGYPHELTSNGF